MEHLDARLGTIAAMVPRCRAVADIGCDHGLLVAALLEGGRCDYGIAADINPMPLEKARQELTIGGASPEVAQHLGIACGAPVALVRRYACDDSGKAIYAALVVHPGDRVRFDIDLVR